MAAIVCLSGAAPLRAQPAAVPIEANVKAVFLFNFAKYVTWPPVTLGERSPAEVRVCVAGNDAFYTLLKSAVEGEDIDGKPIQPVALDGLDEAKSCQILYVGASRSADSKAWLDAVRGYQVLTVVDGPLNDDSVIAFVRDSDRIRFDINRAAASKRNLNVSAKLLRLARQVKDH
ncbi:MAG TPA: YfiR family protein [Vicinamibacterales bacterium]|nr:YfiR family protein [Vicinamibacterales bacterium]